MGPLAVVLVSPGTDFLPGISQGAEPACIQTLVPKPPVETLHVSVLHPAVFSLPGVERGFANSVLAGVRFRSVEISRATGARTQIAVHRHQAEGGLMYPRPAPRNLYDRPAGRTGNSAPAATLSLTAPGFFGSGILRRPIAPSAEHNASAALP